MFFFPDPKNRVIKLIPSDFESLPVQWQVKGRTKISSGEAKQKFNWQTEDSRRTAKYSRNNETQVRLIRAEQKLGCFITDWIHS